MASDELRVLPLHGVRSLLFADQVSLIIFGERHTHTLSSKEAKKQPGIAYEFVFDLFNFLRSHPLSNSYLIFETLEDEIEAEKLDDIFLENGGGGGKDGGEYTFQGLIIYLFFFA